MRGESYERDEREGKGWAASDSGRDVGSLFV